MTRILVGSITLMIAAAALCEESKSPSEEKQLAGMSVVGNDDAPKALVIVPWKSSVLGDTLSVSRMLDEGLQPVDRDVFLRELAYYRIRAASSPASSAGAQ